MQKVEYMELMENRDFRQFVRGLIKEQLAGEMQASLFNSSAEFVPESAKPKTTTRAKTVRTVKPASKPAARTRKTTTRKTKAKPVYTVKELEKDLAELGNVTEKMRARILKAIDEGKSSQDVVLYAFGSLRGARSAHTLALLEKLEKPVSKTVKAA